MASTDFELFKGTTLSDLMKDIYHNSKKKSRQIDGLIQELQPLVKNVGDAAVIVPMIKEYLEVSVKNDDALVKLAAVVQRLLSAGSREEGGGEFILSDEERNRLLQEAEAEIKAINKIAKKNNKIVSVGIRINPNISAKTNKKISTGKKDNKFGISMNACLEIFNNQYHYEYIKFEAISVHIGSQIMDINPFKKVLNALSNFNKKINLIGINLKYIDLGGGTGIPYSNSEKKFNLKQYANLVLKFKKTNNVEIIFEPGRSVCGNTGVLISKVIYLKDAPGKKFIIIDAAMNDLIRPALYGAKHQIYPLLKNSSTIKKNTEFVGPVCESSDTFISYNKYQKLNEGDYVCIDNIGAYGRSLASNYNTRPYCAEILINKNKYKVIKQRQKLESLIN